MKKLFALILVLTIALSLCACKSAEAKNVEELITSIGNVSLDCESSLTAAENAYNALSEEDKASIENHDVLTAARTSFDALRVDALIDAIGDVTLNSESAITAAETAFAALSDETKAQVTKVSVLTNARTAYDTAVRYEEVRLSMVGTWVNEAKGDYAYTSILEDTDSFHSLYTLYDAEGNLMYESDSSVFQLLEDGSFMIDGETLGVWELSEDASTVSITANLQDAASESSVLSVMDEGGFLKLVGSVFNSHSFGYVRADDYEAAFADKFVVATLTSDNVRDYLGDPVALGSATDPNGTQRNCHVFPSQVYDDGLIYLGCACSVQCTGTHKGKAITITNSFPVIGGWSDNVATTGIGNSASGELYYIKADYVAENYIDEEGYRTLVLTNGVTLRFDGYTHYLDVFWSYVNAAYEDYIY